MTTGEFTALVLVGFFAAMMGLRLLAKVETRVTRQVTLAPKLLLGLFFGVLLLFYLDDAMVSDRRDATVRSLFHIAGDVDVGRISGGQKTPVCHRQSVYHRATVQFTPDQFRAYAASLHDRTVWRPVLPPHYLPHKSRFRYADDALDWRDLPAPGWYGRQQLVWKIAGRDVRRGLALCYEITRLSTTEQERGVIAMTEYAVAACDARARTATPAGGGRVRAALDLDNQRLNLEVYFDGRPDYCNNRVTRWLGETLGLQSE